VSDTSRLLTALGRVIRSIAGGASKSTSTDAAGRGTAGTDLLSPGQTGHAATIEVDPRAIRHVRLSYSPSRDGEPDPGEIVWTWVPYEEDHRRGKDRPVLLVGTDGPWLLGVMLSSKDHSRDARDEARWGRYWLDIGSGPWDAQGRDSEVRLDRVIRVDRGAVRREGAVVGRAVFDRVVAGIAAHR
jgi:PemK-like, MazF-like toxin of type II toxin-antitoxin system